MVSNYIIAKLQLSEDVSLMAMINNDTIHIFDSSGNDVQRDILTLPDVFVINFIDGENRAFYLVKEKESINQGYLYVINRDNKVIFTSTIEDAYNVYTRITNNSIIIGVSEIETESDILIPSSSSGKLIDNNQLTNKKLIGIRHNYYLFSEESEGSNEYYLYALRPKFYDTDEPEFTFVRKFHADFLILWKSNVVYYNNCENDINVKAYGAGGYYWDTPEEQSFNIGVDLKNVNWTKDVQILYDEDSIILHHTNASADYNGFTIVIEQIGYDKFRLCNQNRLSDFWNAKINSYTNSLIKFNKGYLYGISIFDKYGNKIAKAEGGYDYVKKRPHITDYAVFAGNLSIPKIKSLLNTNIKLGVLSTEDLEMVVPPNFNKVDFIVLEEPTKKQYRQKGNYEIYIKVCFETVNQQKELVENWGLFKHSECVIPCFYKSIDVIRSRSNFIFILEQQDGLKGVFYKDKIITQCIYEGITELGCYLLMNRPDGLIDILYIDKESIKRYEYISSVTSSTVQLEFLRNVYSNNEAIIIGKNNKYGLICRGELVADYIYDEIKLINANPNVEDLTPNSLSENPLWFILQKDNKKGLFGTHGVMTDINNNEVAVIDWQTYHPKRKYGDMREFVLKLDEKYYTAKEKKLICENDELIFRGFISSYELVFSDEDETCLEFYTYRGEKRDIAVFDSDGDSVDMDDFNDIESMYSDCEYALPIPNVWRKRNIPITISEYKYIFSFSENRIINNPFYKDIDEEDDDDSYHHDYDYPDDTDYERDTYYALGGDNYDEWRNNGGNLDDMMDGMGY